MRDGFASPAVRFPQSGCKSCPSPPLAGTMHYMAPEIVRRERYSLAVDCWSLGVVLYILLCGRLPFDGRDSRGLEEAIDKGTFHMAGPVSQGWGYLR